MQCNLSSFYQKQETTRMKFLEPNFKTRLKPRDFSSYTVVNGVSNMMIFQEHTRKEMIERNKERWTLI